MPQINLTDEQVKQLMECINITNKTLGLNSAVQCLNLVRALQQPIPKPKPESKSEEKAPKKEEVSKDTKQK